MRRRRATSRTASLALPHFPMKRPTSLLPALAAVLLLSAPLSRATSVPDYPNRFGLLPNQSSGNGDDDVPPVPIDQKISVIKQLGIPYIRTEITIASWDTEGGKDCPAFQNYRTYARAGLRMQLNIKYTKKNQFQQTKTGKDCNDNPVTTYDYYYDLPENTSTELTAYSQKVHDILAEMQTEQLPLPEVVAIENEPLNHGYYAYDIAGSGMSVQRYLAELTTAATRIHQDFPGVKVVDGGITRSPLACLVFQYLHDHPTGGFSRTDVQYAKQAVPDNLWNQDTTNPALNPNGSNKEQEASDLINGLAAAGTEYVNFHWYGPHSFAQATNSIDIDEELACLGTAVEVLSKKYNANGIVDLPVMTNEIGATDGYLTPSLSGDLSYVPAILQKLYDLRLSYVMWYSGNTDLSNPQAINPACPTPKTLYAFALNDVTGALNDNGVGFATFISSHFPAPYWQAGNATTLANWPFNVGANGWFTSSLQSTLTYNAGTQDITLNTNSSTQNRHVLAYIPNQMEATLPNIGDEVQLTFKATFDTPVSSGSFRFGLFDERTGTRVSTYNHGGGQDTTAPTNNTFAHYSGVRVDVGLDDSTNIQILERDPANTTGSLLDGVTGTTAYAPYTIGNVTYDNPWAPFYAQTDMTGAYANGTKYSGTLTITNLDGERAGVRAQFTSGSGASLREVDVSAPDNDHPDEASCTTYTTNTFGQDGFKFDMVAFGAHAGSMNALTLDGVKIVYTPAPTPAVAPAITQSPVAASRTTGQSVTFSVSIASGATAPVQYQWYKLKNSVTTLLSGATGSSLTLNNLATTDTAKYYVVVYNTGGTVTSAKAQLTVQ